MQDTYSANESLMKVEEIKWEVLWVQWTMGSQKILRTLILEVLL